MYRATTPTHVFTLPADMVSMIEQMKVTYAQDENVLFELTEDDLTWDGNKASVTLTQEQANMFDYKEKGQVQLRVLTNSGQVFASKMFHFVVKAVLDDEVMS